MNFTPVNSSKQRLTVISLCIYDKNEKRREIGVRKSDRRIIIGLLNVFSF